MGFPATDYVILSDNCALVYQHLAPVGKQKVRSMYFLSLHMRKRGSDASYENDRFCHSIALCALSEISGVLAPLKEHPSLRTLARQT